MSLWRYNWLSKRGYVTVTGQDYRERMEEGGELTDAPYTDLTMMNSKGIVKIVRVPRIPGGTRSYIKIEDAVCKKCKNRHYGH